MEARFLEMIWDRILDRRFEPLTKSQAIELYQTKWWENFSYYNIAEFQLKEQLLCMPMAKYHEAVEKALGRPVFNMELGFPANLLDELRKR